MTLRKSQTKSQTKTAKDSSHQSVPLPEEHVSVHWRFFDRSHTATPLLIRIPNQLFNGMSQDCLQLFADELRKEYGLITYLAAIRFWVPRAPLSFDTADDNGWPATISDLQTAFQRVRPRTSLATALAGQLDDDDLVHLIVTAEGPHVQPGDVQTDETEERDVLGPLPENIRFLGTLSYAGPSPSQGSNSSEYAIAQSKRSEVIYDGRWVTPDMSTVAPPIQIFHPIFETFVHDANRSHIRPSREDIIHTQQLMDEASRIAKQNAHAHELHRLLAEILQVPIHQEQDDDASTPDGMCTTMFEGVSIPFLIWELQLEVGEGGFDASTQAELSMRRIWTQENRAGFVKKCCCPILMLAGSGPWLTVLGGVFTDNLIVQRLTDMMWIGHSTTQDEPRVRRLARVLLALRNSLHHLRDYYVEINNSKHIPAFDVSRPHPRNYPYPTSFLESKSGKTLRFKYVQALENNAKCVTYKAEITDSQGTDAPKDIVVKFVSRYGKAVHKFLAEQNHAPRLRYFGLLDGQSSTKAPDHPAPELPSHALPLSPMNMVVMDYVSPHAKPWPQDAREQISKVLDKLHAEGYVFGDLRSPNVLFDQSNEVKFIDFDWSGSYKPSLPDEALQAGSDQYTCYPLNLSQSIKWADGADDLLPILPEHDWQMLENLLFEE